MRRFACGWALLILLLPFVVSAQFGDENSLTLGRPNLIKNGGMDEGTGIPTGFGTWTAQGKVEITIDRTRDHVFAGLGSCKMTASQVSRANINQTVPVRAGQWVGLSFYAKAENLVSNTHGSGIRVRFLDQNRNEVTSNHLFVNGPKGTKDWYYYERVFQVLDGVSFLSIEPFYWEATGTLWFDELRLVELSEEDLPKDPAEDILPELIEKAKDGSQPLEIPLVLWEGLQIVNEPVKDGTESGRWANHVQTPVVRCSKMPHDWSQFGGLSFWLYSSKANNARFMMIIYSENSLTNGIDYYSAGIQVNWEGWKKFTYQFGQLSPTRSPIGWHQIDRVEFTAQGWDNTPQPDTELFLAHFQLEPKRPRLDPSQIAEKTDPYFFTLLNLDYPGLEEVKAAYNAGDIEGASRAYLEFRRNRTYPKWWFDWKSRPQLPGTATRQDAELICQHIIDGYFVGDPIDWDFNPLSPTDPAYTREWTWQKLHRFPHWVTLGQAYWQTGNEKYAQEWIDQMLDWVVNSPVPASIQNSSWRWRTIEAGIRTAGSWMNTYHYFLTSPSLTPQAHSVFVRSFFDHAEYLMMIATNPNQTGNWVAMENNGLATIGIMFPEFKDASLWRETAINRLYHELEAQVYPDGAQIELAPSYHGVSLDNFMAVVNLCKLNDIPLPADYVAKLERMFDFYLYMAQPSGGIPSLNDSWPVNLRAQLQKGYDLFGREDFLYVATMGTEGKEPAFRSYAFPYAGYYIMRTGWNKHDKYLLFDGGPCGGWHGNDDKLAILLEAYGQPMLVEAGVYSYDQSKWREFSLSTAGHNTILVDGLGQNRRNQGTAKPPFKKADTLWLTGPIFDYASGSYTDGYGPQNQLKAVHQRSVLFVKPNYFLIRDVVDGADKGSHHIESLYNIQASEAFAVNGKVFTQEPGSPNLLIQQVEPEGITTTIYKGSEEPMRGWIAMSHQAIPAASFQQSGQFPLKQTVLVHPFPEEVQEITTTAVAPTDSGWSGWAVRVESPVSRDFVVVQSETVSNFLLAGETIRVGAQILVERDFGDHQYWGAQELSILETPYFILTATGPAEQLAIVRQGKGHYVLANTGSAPVSMRWQSKEDVPGCIFQLNQNLERGEIFGTETDNITLTPGQMVELTPNKQEKLAIASLQPPDKYELAFQLPRYRDLGYPAAKELNEILRIRGVDFSEEIGGKVTLVNNKVGADDWTFKDWDPLGHTLSWDFELEEEGYYALGIRYCAATPATRRLFLDGKTPFLEAESILFPETGGWSNERDDWRNWIFSDSQGQPYLFHLPAGKHRLTMRNTSASGLNIHYLTVLKAEVR